MDRRSGGDPLGQAAGHGAHPQIHSAGQLAPGFRAQGGILDNTPRRLDHLGSDMGNGEDAEPGRLVAIIEPQEQASGSDGGEMVTGAAGLA